MRTAIAIVGAGIAGLSAAWELVHAGHRDFVLLEAGSRPGGTLHTDSADGFLAESGPDSFLTHKEAAAALCRELGLDNRLLPTLPNPAGARIWHGGQFHPLPAGWRLLAPTQLRPLLGSSLFPRAAKLRLALGWRRAAAAPPPHDDESAAAYLRRRFGGAAGEALAAAVAGPLLAGVYGGDIEQLSAASFTPAPAPEGPRPAPGASLFTTLRGGMGALVAALVARLPAGALRLQCPVAAIAADPKGGYRLELESGEALAADAVIVATPAWAAADVLRPLDASLAEALAAIPYASSVNLNLAFQPAPTLPAGHGFLVSRGQGLRLLACTFAHQKFAHRAPAGAALLRVFYGAEEAAADDAQLTALAQAELATLLGIHARPRRVTLRRCPRAMPQYTVGHRQRLAAIAAALARHSRLHLAGNAFDGVGVPDCIASGRAAAHGLI